MDAPARYGSKKVAMVRSSGVLYPNNSHVSGRHGYEQRPFGRSSAANLRQPDASRD